MADTRMKVANSATIYFRRPASGDAGAADSASIDTNHSGLGCSVDFLLKAGVGAQATATHHAVVADDETGAISALAGTPSTTAIEEGFIMIKHSGYTSSAKTTASDKYLKVSVGVAISSNVWFALQPQEAIILHFPFASGTDATGNYYLQSESGDIYVEVITGNDA